LTTMILASRTDSFLRDTLRSQPQVALPSPLGTAPLRNGRPVNKFTTLPAGFANRQALVTRHVSKSFVILTRSAPKTHP
jgi:hypothetical protein